MASLILHDIFLVLTSVFATTALFNIALYFGHNRKLAYLFFAFYCTFHIFKVWLKTFPTDQILLPVLNLTAFELIYCSVIFGLFSLNVFLAYHHNITFRRSLIISFGIFSIFAFFLLPEPIYIYISVSTAIGQTIPAIRKNRTSIIFLVGLIILLSFTILGVVGIVGFGYFLGTILLILLMVLASGIELAHQTRNYHLANYRSTRLENQLLKKSIQPHFILNSLTSLQELIEYEPQKASKFVEDLSTEFKLFSRVSERQMISFEDEERLIRSYIGIMSVRLNKQFNLNTRNFKSDDQVPPGMFLTIVENGISHGYADKEHGTFNIVKVENDVSIKYLIENDGCVPNVDMKEGLGLQYVRSRLDESYSGKYKLMFEPFKHGFRSILEIQK